MDIQMRKIEPTLNPDIKVTVVFGEKPHNKVDRESIVEEISSIVAKYSRMDRAKVQVDLEYRKES